LRLIITWIIINSLCVQTNAQNVSDSYIQLASVYFIKSGSKTISLSYKLLLYDQGRYLSNINTNDMILLKAYFSKTEKSKFGVELLKERALAVKTVFTSLCGIDSTRFIIQLIENPLTLNKDPLANQRVDVEILH
jgi:hypothetical protein